MARSPRTKAEPSADPSADPSAEPGSDSGAWAKSAWLLGTLAAVTVYLPMGAAGLAALLWLALAMAGLLLGAWSMRREGLAWLVMWLTWIALSGLWSPAPWPSLLSHGWHAAVMLAVPLLASTLRGDAALRAIQAFVLASVVLAGLWSWQALWPLPPSDFSSTLLVYAGNKSISNGVLMALASALALHLAWQAGSSPAMRAAWLLAAACLAAVILWRSPARSAHMVLAVLLLAVVWLHQRRWWPRLLMLAVAAAVAASVALGLGGLGARSQAGQLDTSNQQRWQVYRSTAAFALERPLIGHGLGSWEVLWAERNQVRELRSFNTAHSAPLELAAEGGAVSLVLLFMVMLAWAGVARRGDVRANGGPAALVLLAWGTEALFNAALRDAAFALPMMVLLALALAAAGASQRRSG